MQVVLSGASSAGKSTLLAALAKRGLTTVPEPGRRVITTGGPRPENDPVGFSLACFDLALADHAAHPGPALFDRSAIDAAITLGLRGESPPQAEPAYAQTVFMAPPWADIYVTDPERRHGFVEAAAEYDALLEGFRDRGYRIRLLPLTPLEDRVEWMLDALADLGWPGLS